jgi:hypothetical protein
LNGAGLNNGFASNNWTNLTTDGGVIDRDRAIAMGDYIQFGFALDGSHEASLTDLDLSLRRSATNGPMNFEIQVSLDSFATAGTTVETFQYLGRTSGSAAEPNPTLTDPFVYMTTDTGGRPDATSSPSDPIPTVDLSSIGLLQDIAAGTTVTFRLYGWGNDLTTASNTVGFRVTGPRVSGFITTASGSGGAVPEPSSILMAGIVAALVGVCRRPRQSR